MSAFALPVAMLALVGAGVVSTSDPEVSGGHSYYTVQGTLESENSAGSPGTTPTGGGSAVEATWVSTPVCAVGGAATCVEQLLCADGSVMQDLELVTAEGDVIAEDYYCPSEGAPAPEPVVITAGMVAQALRRVELPASVLRVQPPGGRTLVNFETNFFTEAAGFERSVVLLGQRVDLRIRPVSFGWRFGDGASLRTSGPGAPYPDLEVTHSYLRKGSVSASVDTTYEADFRVNGGAWAPVPGTVTMTGEGVGLQVRTATPTLMGYR